MTPHFITSLLAWPWFGVLARTALTLPYWTSGLSKLSNIKAALAETEELGVRPARFVLACTIVLELGGSLAIIVGRYTWLAAGGLAVFTCIAALLAYPFWRDRDPSRRFNDRNAFFEHVGLIGGCMLVSILAAGGHG
ncbi:DoxX family protein [Burkholderia sp. Ac-20379]|uniref:DoxX family protein n=1 Tax=Burkholderia sp. Ac-20379 TaxID=2703900 RepID=UPI00197DC649|nr:DoxX family protein [Burkholderia sp. Ac-20379]MBN3724699.1 DoxX family protein [Burkholderia sp. Ac-20379]